MGMQNIQTASMIVLDILHLSGRISTKFVITKFVGHVSHAAEDV